MGTVQVSDGLPLVAPLEPELEDFRLEVADLSMREERCRDFGRVVLDMFFGLGFVNDSGQWFPLWV